MKPIKMLGLAAMAALLAMAFASSAMASNTQLCKVDELNCAAGNVITHVHEVSVGKMKLLSSPTVECNVLFLGDSLGLAAPLIIHGTFTYTSCNNFCTVTQVGSALILVLREGSHLARVTDHVLIEVSCFFGFKECSITTPDVIGHGLDPLTATGTKGRIVISGKKVTYEINSCPEEEAFLDLTTEPLENTYISE